MALVKTNAIVISALKYSEADLIVKAYTLSDGLKTYHIRGVLKSRKGKLRTAMFQPLTQLHIEASHKDKGTLEHIREARVIHHYQELHTQVVKSAIVLFLSEMLRNVIQEEEANPDLYEYLITTFNWLDLENDIANFHLLFLTQLTRYLGFTPDESTLPNPYFNLLDGTFEPSEQNFYCQTGEHVNILITLLGTKFDALHETKLNQNQRAAVLHMLLQYYELHMQGFKKPRSLAVLNTIFS